MQKEARKQLGVIGAAMLLPMSALAADNNFVGSTGIAGSLKPKTESVFNATQQAKHQRITGPCLTKQVNLLLVLRLF